MQIDKHLPQFSKTKALLLTTGKQTATLYLGYKGQVKEIASFSIPTPTYTDREGFFERRSGGGVLGSGSVYEAKEKDTRDKFLAKLVGEIKNTNKKYKYQDVYLFAPQYIKNTINKKLPTAIKKLVKKEFTGNYTKSHPFVLIQHIREWEGKKSQKTKPTSKEAKKILEKSNQARHVIKGKPE